MFFQGLTVPTVGTSMTVTFTHVFLWGSSATNHIENALMGSPCVFLILIVKVCCFQINIYIQLNASP
jgi:hypothetical protein